MHVLIISGSERHIENNAFYSHLRSAFINFNEQYFKTNNQYLEVSEFNEYQPMQIPSLNSVILGATLEDIGVSYDLLTGILLDSTNGILKLDELLHKRYYDVIAISTTLIFTTNFIRRLVEHIKQIQKNSVIVVGGQLLFDNKELLDVSLIDYFVFGDGEDAFPILIKEIIKGNKEPHIKGVIYRQANTIIGDNTFKLIDINNQRIKIWDKFLSNLESGKKEYISKNTVFPLLIETTRGCPYKCTFCNYGIYGSKVRYKSAVNIYSEIDELYRLGVRKIGFWDSTFTYPNSRLIELMDLLQKANYQDLEFSGFATIQDLNKGIISRLSSLGFRELFIGIESGNDHLLNAMNKKIKREEIISLFNSVYNIKSIDFICSFIVGFPGENDDSIEDTIDLIKKIRVRFIELASLRVRKGSELYRNPHKYGLNFEMDGGTNTAISWKHITMNSEQANQNVLKIFNRISLETDSLVIAPLLHITGLTQKYDPLKSEKNFELLKLVQRGISFTILNDKKNQTKICFEIEKLISRKISNNIR